MKEKYRTNIKQYNIHLNYNRIKMSGKVIIYKQKNIL